ncbi:TVP38/TMEM64 family protein [Paenibacillus albicereus]|uniref:TVP38/TMEM64 family membrane protein n=1 Tax=Paenibacillus albicereus TaxID=2726185 RepID=A0A6H2GU87_9BACL|nr:VTT domain-containing protein [Paenibacillus albicereus]QJC50919.1 TVP38/TMEM64 family protein [Paenibacillus albicereus]
MKSSFDPGGGSRPGGQERGGRADHQDRRLQESQSERPAKPARVQESAPEYPARPARIQESAPEYPARPARVQESAPEHPARPARVWPRVLAALLYAALLGLVWYEREAISAWLAGARPEPLPMLAAAFALALFPVFPYAVVIGALGYLFGPLGGSLISLGGTWLACLASYAGFRLFFRDRGRAWLAKAGRLKRLVRLTERSPFLFVAVARAVPVVPEMTVDAYAALTGIRLRTYAAASLLGKAPGMLFFATLGGSGGSGPLRIGALVLAYLAFLAAVFIAYRMLTASPLPPSGPHE